jgi:predicted Rossmann fold flavoprotein
LHSAYNFDAIIVGAGAAGLMCATEASKRGRSVALLEHSDRPGKKILISGGGRCNFTHTETRPENFLSANPHFAKSALARYTPADFVALVEKHEIPYHEKSRGQLFCDRSARDILHMLEEECAAAGVKVFLQVRIDEISRPESFKVRARQGGEEKSFHSPVLVIATGGLSIPKMGATSFGYEIAKQFGLRIQETRPGLVPLTFHPHDLKQYGDLAGIAMSVAVKCGKTEFRDKLLFTHRGLSGPAILQISSYWREGESLRIDLISDTSQLFENSNTPRNLRSLQSSLRTSLPTRLADRWLELHTPDSWTNVSMRELEESLHSWTIVPAGTEGYGKAEVTAGGVDTRDLSAKTMESTKVPGLFFIGEVVDVTGQLGGFNFQWAWASGAAAGRAL